MSWHASKNVIIIIITPLKWWIKLTDEMQFEEFFMK